MATFGERFARLIRERGWTQLEAAEKLGVSQALISRYLRGKREPLPRTIAYLADRLGIPVGELMGGRASVQKHRLSEIQVPNDSSINLPNEAMTDLKRRWNRKPHERETLKHLICMLFPKHCDRIVAWLEEG
jgi:transcriptional regulator with XRE-family HTH domain